MDERRGYFRVTNKGDIQAHYGNYPLDVVNLSSSGMVVIKKNIHLDKEGIIDVSIHNLKIPLSYELIRIDKQTMVLVFKNTEETNKLLLALKNLRNKNHDE